MLLPETTVNTNSVVDIYGYPFYYSTGVEEQDIARTNDELEEAHPNGEQINDSKNRQRTCLSCNRDLQRQAFR